MAKEILQITANRQRGTAAPEQQVIASVYAIATVACNSNSANSISDALLNPLVASAAADETRAEQEERPEKHATNRSVPALEERERKWRRATGKKQPLAQPPENKAAKRKAEAAEGTNREQRRKRPAALT